MILRMYELAASEMDRVAGWPGGAGAHADAVGAGWPAGQVAIELAVADNDAQGRPVDDAHRRRTARRLVPWLLDRLLAGRDDRAGRWEDVAGEEIAVIGRIDGWLRRGGLAEALLHVADSEGRGLFHLPRAARYQAQDPEPPAVVTLALTPVRLDELMGDPQVNWGPSLRLRLWAVPRELAPVLLDCIELDDERWPELLRRSRLMISTSATMQSVFVVGPQSAQVLRERLTG